ncbi:hypothetical protein ACLOJK_040840 [Asimina triloba]
MDPQSPQDSSSPPPPSPSPSPSCYCPSCCQSSWKRSVKRKLDRIAEDGLDACVARVEIENECAALRETLARQQQTIHDLYLELDEERSASTSAANETMSMILRLQREKAEVQMEARQFKRIAEEKMAHDQQELLTLEDVLYKRDQLIQSLTFEIQAYKHRLMSLGCTEHEAELAEQDIPFEFPTFDYPPLKCDPYGATVSQSASDDDEPPFDLDKYPSGETPRQCLRDLEFRIQQLEQGTASSRKNSEGYPSTRNFVEKVAVGLSPRQPSRFSIDSRSSFPVLVKETHVQETLETPRTVVIGSIEQSGDFLEGDLRKADNASECGDDLGDRVYTVDSVQTKATARMCDDYEAIPQSAMMDTDIKKLYLRLQALEADRESMRLAIISMRTEKAQLVLLREIAQQLCREMPPGKRVSVKKTSATSGFSLISTLKVCRLVDFSIMNALCR